MTQRNIASTLKQITLASLLAGFFTACGTTPSAPSKPTVTPKPSDASPAPTAPKYVATTWPQLPQWTQDDLIKGFQTWRNGCAKLQKNPVWAPVCQEAASVPANTAAIRSFLQTRLMPYQLQNPDNSTTGLITGYYEPIYAGNTVKSNTSTQPVYGPPTDMITVALDSVYPELKGKRLRGKLV
ncbi:MAG: MltA domain-containing protein, partial [Deefgea sp.]